MMAASLPTSELNKRVIPQSLMDDFEWYVKYASGASTLLVRTRMVMSSSSKYVFPIQ